MKNILKNQIIALLALAVLFGMPGFTLPPNLTAMFKPLRPVLQMPQKYPELSAVKVLSASPLGFLQKPFQVQKTEDVSTLQQDGNYAVQASLVNNSYQFGNISSVFSGVVLAEQSAQENLRVSPLQIAVRNLFKPASDSFFESFSPWSGLPSEEKGLLQVVLLVFRPKTSPVSKTNAGITGGQGVLRNYPSVYTSFGEEGFVFRC